MPLYEYTCRACGERFEILQRLLEGADGLECPACGDHRVEKQFSTFASGAGGSSASTGFSAPSGGCGGSGFG